MKKILLLPLLLLFFINSYGQEKSNQELIALGKAYKDLMFRNSPDKKYLKDFSKKFKKLETEAAFIKETITTKNDLLKADYLKLPDETVLKNIYIIREINLLLREESDITTTELIDSLQNKEISHYELVNNYYGMLFTAVGNKNKPFDLSKIDFSLEEYSFQDEVDEGIFFLRCMEMCGANIWGLMNIPKPPNTEKALELINLYPKFNGKPYYQYTDLYFKDFEMEIITGDGLQSYKTYYLHKYYDALLSHFVCLIEEDAPVEEQRDILLGSIMKDEKLWKYTKHKEVLASIFKKKEPN